MEFSLSYMLDTSRKKSLAFMSGIVVVVVM